VLFLALYSQHTCYPQWFIFKYDKQASGLAGLAFDEGLFGVFGESLSLCTVEHLLIRR